MRPQSELPDPELVDDSYQIPDEQQNTPDPVLSEEFLLEEKWKQVLDDECTDILEISADGNYLYRIDSEGSMTIYDSQKKICYQEHFSIPIYHSLALEEGLVLGDWEGHLFVYHKDQPAWQAYLNSPISALKQAGEFLAAGCWNGTVTVRNLSDGKEINQTVLPDAVSALDMRENGELAAGDLAGHLILFNAQLETLWKGDFSSSIVQIEAAGPHYDQLLVLLKNDQLINIQMKDQLVNWQHCFDQLSKREFSLSSSRKQIAFLHDQQFVIFRMGKDLKLVSSQKMPEGIKGVFLPLFQDARFIALQTRDGFFIADLYQSKIYPIFEGELVRWCYSKDGRKLSLSTKSNLLFYSLTEPELTLKISPVNLLYQNRFSRLRLQIKNHGKRLARQIKVTLAGAVKSNPYVHTADILPGTQFVTEDYSVNIGDEGAIPVQVKVTYEDDFGIAYTTAFDCILDVQAQ